MTTRQFSVQFLKFFFSSKNSIDSGYRVFIIYISFEKIILFHKNKYTVSYISRIATSIRTVKNSFRSHALNLSTHVSAAIPIPAIELLPFFFQFLFLFSEIK